MRWIKSQKGLFCFPFLGDSHKDTNHHDKCNCPFLNGARRWPHKLPVMGQDKSEKAKGHMPHLKYQFVAGQSFSLSLCRYQSLLLSCSA